MSEPKTSDPMIAALLREREGYLRADRVDRAALVDEQLAARGYVEEHPARQVPQDRQTPPKQTADQQTRPARKAAQKAD